MATRMRRKILFVDDEPHWRDSVSASLTAAGFDVLTASDGSEAMAQATDPSLGLIIVDEDLAGESGLMLTKFLRHNHPDVPSMLHTSLEHDVNETLDMTSQGPDQCVPKGSVEELIVNVGCCLR